MSLCLEAVSYTHLDVYKRQHQNKPFAKIQDGMTAIPYGEIYDENGNVNPYPIEGDAGYLNLLMNNKSNWRNQSQNTKLYVNPYIKITPIKGLTWESRVNGTLTYSRSNSFQGDGSYNFCLLYTSRCV